MGPAGPIAVPVPVSRDPDRRFTFPGSYRAILAGDDDVSALSGSTQHTEFAGSFNVFNPIFDRAEFLGTVLSLEQDLCPGGVVSGPTLT